VHNLAIGNGAHFVERLAICIAVHGPNINSFMKAGVNDASSSTFRITDKAVLATFPWCRFHAVVVSVDRLVESGAVSRKKGIIVRGQNKIENLVLCGQRNRQKEREYNSGEQESHGR
jgi:hypothetical protein